MKTPKNLTPIDYTPSGYVFNPQDESMSYEEWKAQRLRTMCKFELMFGMKKETDYEGNKDK